MSYISHNELTLYILEDNESSRLGKTTPYNRYKCCPLTQVSPKALEFLRNMRDCSHFCFFEAFAKLMAIKTTHTLTNGNMKARN